MKIHDYVLVVQEEQIEYFRYFKCSEAKYSKCPKNACLIRKI